MRKKRFYLASGLLVGFILWTMLISFVDLQPIGPNNSTVGFATINRYFHQLTDVHMSLYNITDWLGLIPLAFVMGFAVLGLVQWIQRKKLGNVDRNILVLGIFYIVVLSAYLLFEEVVINYRPILINGNLEASYPSSTTILVLCIMPTSIMQFKKRIHNMVIYRLIAFLIVTFILFMVIGRLISGVHWITDIVGGIFLSSGLVIMYESLC